jgi:hypothetical protein
VVEWKRRLDKILMKILIKRKESKYWDERKQRVFVNGKLVATLKQNQSQEIDIAENNIVLECKLNSSWLGSKKMHLNINNGDVIETENNAKFSKYTLYLMSPTIILLMVAKGFDSWIKWFFWGLLVVDLLLLIYLLVIARRKWVFINHTQH